MSRIPVPVRAGGVVLAATLLLSGCAGLRPGTAVEVGDEQITTSEVDDVTTQFCAALEEPLDQQAQTIPHGYFRGGIAGVLAMREVATQVAADYGVEAELRGVPPAARRPAGPDRAPAGVAAGGGGPGRGLAVLRPGGADRRRRGDPRRRGRGQRLRAGGRRGDAALDRRERRGVRPVAQHHDPRRRRSPRPTPRSRSRSARAPRPARRSSPTPRWPPSSPPPSAAAASEPGVAGGDEELLEFLR